MPTRASKSGPRYPKNLSEPVEQDMTPDQLAAILEADADPLVTLAEIAKEAGLGLEQTKALVSRVRGQYQPVVRELRKVTTQGLTTKIEDRLDAALDYLTDDKLAASSAKDVAITIGILLEKRQLLRGEPTAILGIDERRNLNELVKETLAEAQRRGMLVEDRGDVIDVTPATTRPTAKSKGKDLNLFVEKRRQEEVGEPD